ncbi:lipid A deacylase LpxR family protein [Vibrio alginolyticus]|uniref:Lipid A deacylase LpxR family protein n=2 Tax=Vibrio harveyi group TaxID=717610 RepID=A0A7Y0MSK2_VIBAL|nr:MULTISPECIES: lipid A deacylase LpxR family protein [Vibrio]EGQ7902698.1 lipid A deacylase LpxR family protein [Vibrio alginolyticus]EIE5865681.1 lipid A deacylase LpxR family protein [Vibrio alginolyticus]EII3281556.1 lipid A deacylase LpxR family protein [Vibrio alginolyticus]EJN8558089.1 lipid A deacylase LpxR family protein [Vibrio alginolyticus]ELA6638653.1 lipid A deacylase LpxR family protein [Vibrio alginolyticus]
MRFSKLIILTLLSPVAIASTKSTVSFTIDNDGIFGVDQDYTNGVFLSYATDQLIQESQWKWLSLANSEHANIDKIELVLGHKMWTPSDIEADYPLINDRPYAGYLHTEINYLSLTSDKAVRYNFTIGATGESSLSEKAQEIVHGITGSTDPQGWDYQIEDKVAFSLGYRVFNKLMRSEEQKTQWEITNINDINAGNFRSDVSQGVMFRWGTNLANSIGAANISVESPFSASMIAQNTSSWFLFTGFEGRYRFNDMTIEGDRPGIPEPSAPYDVTLQNWQASAVAGVSWYNQNYGASITFTIKTPDYEEAQTDVYGTGSFSVFAFF